MAHPVERAAREIINLIVARNYAGVVRLTRGRRFTASDIDKAISVYGRLPVSPPENALERCLDVVEVFPAPNRTWSVRAPLWTAEEGKSDLSVELTVTETDHGLSIELEDIHVL